MQLSSRLPLAGDSPDASTGMMRLAWAKDKKDWTAAKLRSLMEVPVAFPWEIKSDPMLKLL